MIIARSSPRPLGLNGRHHPKNRKRQRWCAARALPSVGHRTRMPSGTMPIVFGPAVVAASTLRVDSLSFDNRPSVADLGDGHSHCCFLDPTGACLTEGRIRTTPEALARHFQGLPPDRIAIEVGGHSRWVGGFDFRVLDHRALPEINLSITAA
jgi:hypothetical protein